MSVPVLEGRHALITGAGRGIGAAIAAQLAARGARVTLLSRSQAPLDDMFADRACAVSADVTDEAAVSRAFATAEQRLGPIDILINNAGSAESAPLARSDSALWRRMLAVNLDGVFFCTRAALPKMGERGWGRVITIASTAGLTGYAYVSAYCAAKHGAIGLTRALALETAKLGKDITVNAVCPGYTDTELTRETIARIQAKTGRSEAEALAELTRVNPQQRLVQPSEVAATVAWLCGPDTTAITGQAIAVAGGEVL